MRGLKDWSIHYRTKSVWFVILQATRYNITKSGIHGDIKPQSRSACDFGVGFYMGDKPEKLAVFKQLCMRYDAYNKQYDKSDTDQIQAGTGR